MGEFRPEMPMSCAHQGGIPRALRASVARRYQELVAWQLADELRERIVALTEESPAARDSRFSEHIRECASAVPANLAEGFCRYSHKQFAHFAVIARSSLAETQVRLKDGSDRHYLSRETYQELFRLANRAMIAITRLHTYLRTHPDPTFPPRNRA